MREASDGAASSGRAAASRCASAIAARAAAGKLSRVRTGSAGADGAGCPACAPARRHDEPREDRCYRRRRSHAREAVHADSISRSDRSDPRQAKKKARLEVTPAGLEGGAIGAPPSVAFARARTRSAGRDGTDVRCPTTTCTILPEGARCPSCARSLLGMLNLPVFVMLKPSARTSSLRFPPMRKPRKIERSRLRWPRPRNDVAARVAEAHAGRLRERRRVEERQAADVAGQREVADLIAPSGGCPAC